MQLCDRVVTHFLAANLNLKLSQKLAAIYCNARDSIKSADWEAHIQQASLFCTFFHVLNSMHCIPWSLFFAFYYKMHDSSHFKTKMKLKMRAQLTKDKSLTDVCRLNLQTDSSIYQ